MSESITPVSRYVPGAALDGKATERRLRVLYVGDDGPHTTSWHRATAIERLGHEVVTINPKAFTGDGPNIGRIHWRTGYRLVRRTVTRGVLTRIHGEEFDVVWVGGGEHVTRQLVRQLKQVAPVVLNYNNDDPFGGRDGRRWDTYLEAVPEYDLLVVLREPNVKEAIASGAAAVHRVWMTYDEVAHRPRDDVGPEDGAGPLDEVVFIGTYMPERSGFLADLVGAGVPLAIYGDRWQKAPDWKILSSVWRGPALRGADYVRTVQRATVALGLLSKGNRDLHTQRSVEIPAMRGLLCAERTSEHAMLYEEGREAIFWSDAEECAHQCRQLLDDRRRARRVAEAGYRRVQASGVGNESLARDVLSTALRL